MLLTSSKTDLNVSLIKFPVPLLVRMLTNKENLTAWRCVEYKHERNTNTTQTQTQTQHKYKHEHRGGQK